MGLEPVNYAKVLGLSPSQARTPDRAEEEHRAAGKAESHRLNHRQIAAEAGFPRPYAISSVKCGRTKVPMTKVPSLAKVLDIDAKHLLELCFRQYEPRYDRSCLQRLRSGREYERPTGCDQPTLLEWRRRAAWNRSFSLFRRCGLTSAPERLRDQGNRAPEAADRSENGEPPGRSGPPHRQLLEGPKQNS